MRALSLFLLFGCRTDLSIDDGSLTEDPEPDSPEAAGRPDPHFDRDTTAPDGGSPAVVEDLDADGIDAALDCDDTDPTLGALLYDDDLSVDAGVLVQPPALDDPWFWDGDGVYATMGGQQALLGPDDGWDDVAVFATLTSQGTRVSCGFDCEESCGEVEPEDCYTEWEALGLGILSAQATATGVITFSNAGAWDVCLESGATWDAASTQGVFVGEWNSDDEYRVPAGGSLDVYYGSWTTDNGKHSPYLDDPDFWCFQNGTTLVTGSVYDSIGAYITDEIFDLAVVDSDLDADGVEDHVDWEDSFGVQAQYNIWDWQQAHGAVVVGKRAAGGPGALTVTLTVENRGALASTATVTDQVPELWSLVSCDLGPDTETLEGDGTVTLTWDLALDGCTADCSVVDEVVVTCELVHNLDVDVDMVELAAARADWDDGMGTRTSWSMPAVGFGYDHNGDGDVTCGDTDRWRAGVLARATLDPDQDEGYHGYRCALAQNRPEDCYDEGHFLQIAEFMDHAEDDVDSECTGDCDNPTFDELRRVDHDGSIDLSTGDVATLAFYLVGETLWCEASDEAGHSVSAQVDDPTFSSGAVGLSTLNMFGDYDHIRVCEALAVPE